MYVEALDKMMILCCEYPYFAAPALKPLTKSCITPLSLTGWMLTSTAVGPAFRVVVPAAATPAQAIAHASSANAVATTVRRMRRCVKLVIHTPLEEGLQCPGLRNSFESTTP